MGAAQSDLGLPQRVNLVYGGQFALAKPGHGNGPVQAVPAHVLLTSPSRRKAVENKWYLRAVGEEHDEDGSATVCIIRNDRHPQRSLHAGDPVEANNHRRDHRHFWEIVYQHDHPLHTDAVKLPFDLRSVGRRGKPYLVVDTSTGVVVLQKEKPTALWQFFDAAGSTESLRVSFAHSLSFSAAESPVNRTPSILLQTWRLQPVEESVEEVFSAQPSNHDGTRSYSSPDVFFSVGEALCESVEIAQPPSTLYGVYHALLGENSQFRQRLCDGDKPQVAPMQRLERQPGCGTAAAKCLASIPVLGKRAYEETLRVALCKEDGRHTLAVQVAGTLKIGFPVGDFLTETLHLFTQDGDGGTVRLRSWGLAQPGAQQRKALEGMKAKQLEYIAHVQQSIQEASQSSLQLAAHPSAALPMVATRPHAAASSPEASPFTASTSPPARSGFAHRTLGSVSSAQSLATSQRSVCVREACDDGCVVGCTRIMLGLRGAVC